MQFVIETTLEALALILILVGIWNEEKVIAFEDKLADKLAWYIAQVIGNYRRIKSHRKTRWVSYKNRPEEVR